MTLRVCRKCKQQYDTETNTLESCRYADALGDTGVECEARLGSVRHKRLRMLSLTSVDAVSRQASMCLIRTLG